LGWNLFLALAPLGLALYLFRPAGRRGLLWWPLLVLFIAFLPNAAYTLTDIIHFVEEVRAKELETWGVVYIVIPKYALFIFLGFQAHVLSLIRVGSYLRWIGAKSWIVAAEMSLNLLCAIGVYWGRYLRLNSWNLFTKPQRIADQLISDLADQWGLGIIAWYFILISVLYYAFKIVDLALYAYFQRQHLKPSMDASALSAQD
jgi:uncharacterized membrane protein